MFYKITRPAYIFSSPWLLTAAAALLIGIVVTFAFHNFRLEQRLMTEAMAQKASTLMQVLHSGSRASFMNDLRKDYWNNDTWQVHVQRIIDHLAEDKDLRFLALTDEQGKVIAHSNHDQLGQTLKLAAGAMKKEQDEAPPRFAYAVEVIPEYGRVFKATRRFFPVFPGQLPLRAMREWHPRMFQHHQGGGWGATMNNKFPDGGGVSSDQYFVVLGLDMTEFDQTLGRLQMQIVILSVAMLLVGLGGWFSLSAVQGYRISQKTIDDMQAYTSLLIAKLPVGIIATDADGRITTWNQAVTDVLGLDKPVALGKQPSAVLPEPLAACFAAEAMGDKPAEMPATADIRLTAGGRRCSLMCHPLRITDSAGLYRGKVLLISDVTALKSMEQRMRESERLAAIGRMAGGVAHEVRNPLSSIKGLALLLKNKFPQASQEQATADLLIQETERMNRTITEMLSMTRPAPLRMARVDLAALLHRSQDLIRAEAQDSGILLHLQTGDDLRPVAGDTDRLQQVFMNVLINAMQAMERGGQLTINLNNGEDQDEVEIRITDTGKGIPPELLSQVFYPYFTTKAGGSGIGLAISQKIVADHQGTMEIESELNRGTTVIIRLPVWDNANAGDTPEGAG